MIFRSVCHGHRSKAKVMGSRIVQCDVPLTSMDKGETQEYEW